MAANLYNQYVWLIDTIRSAGYITKHELDVLWAKAPLNDKKETVYPLRTFHRHREAITELFGLYIACDKLKGNAYYISKGDNLREDAFRVKLCNTLSYANLLIDSAELQKRVIFDKKDDGSDYLSVILYAMRDKLTLRLELKEKGAFPVAVVPYCLREHDGMWYLAAKQVNGGENEEVSVYPLVSVENVTLLKEKKNMPRWFNGEIFFNSYFEHAGVSIAKKVKPAEKVEKKVKEVAPKETKKKEPAKTETPEAGEQLSLF